MHITDKECGLIMATGIVGSGIPVACGTAFASKYKKENRITCVFMGDGSANEGVFYESMNLAVKWGLPIIFVIEDNGVAVTTLTERTSACRNYSKLADVFAMDSTTVNGQMIEEVLDVAQKAVSYVRNGNGPFLIQAKTIRFREHAEGTYYWKMRESGYRDLKKLYQDEDNKCPIKSYVNILKKRGALNDIEYQKILNDVSSEVQNALEYALVSPEPEMESALKNVYIE